MRCEIIGGMDDHQHTPVKFYSDAFEKPIMVQCEECGEVLDVSVDFLNSKYQDDPTRQLDSERQV